MPQYNRIEIEKNDFLSQARKDMWTSMQEETENAICKSLMHNIWNEQIITQENVMPFRRYIKIGEANIFHLIKNIWTILKASHLKGKIND